MSKIRAGSQFSAQFFSRGVSSLLCSSGQEYVSSSDDTAFVISDFSGPSFDTLASAECTVFGPTAVKELVSANPGHPLHMNPRPLFCNSMRGVAIAFNGYRSREFKRDLKRFLFLIHSMGGRVLPDVTAQKNKVTHLVSRNCRGEQYKYASTFDIPVMQEAWLQAAWERRRETGFAAGQEDFVSHFRVKPFHGAQIHFLGFSEEEKAHMASELRRNGGRECVDYKSADCTHVVVDSGTVHSMPPEVRKETHVVKVGTRNCAILSVATTICSYAKGRVVLGLHPDGGLRGREHAHLL